MILKFFFFTIFLTIQITYISPADTDGFNIESTKAEMYKMPRSRGENRKRFAFITMMPATWHRAAHICKYNGMELAAVNSQEEHKKLVELAEATGFKAQNGFWTGGNDLGLKNNWYWLASGKPLNYTNWKPGEPNNFNNLNERCLNIQPKVDNYLWNDAPCDFVLYFACEEYW